MITFVCQALCEGECFIDVAFTNTVARRLYTYFGFSRVYAQPQHRKTLLGFGAVIRIKKQEK